MPCSNSCWIPKFSGSNCAQLSLVITRVVLLNFVIYSDKSRSC